jgi:Uma2 family endonuclease
MSSTMATLTQLSAGAALRRFTVQEYHQMIQAGILDEDDQVELLDGYVVLKMPRNPPHDGTIDLVHEALSPHLPTGWFLRIQQAITLAESEPEPDFAIVRGHRRRYLTSHPGPADVGLLIEVSESTLSRDRDDKGPIYAQAGIPCYWIVNLIDSRVEVYGLPSGAISPPGYGSRQDFAAGASISLVLDGVTAGTIAVADLLP